MRLLELNLGMGNLRSLQKAVEYCGAQVQLSDRPEEIKEADGLLLPGDGAFGRAMQEIHTRDLRHALEEYVQMGGPVLGICLGFQLLFEASEEFGQHQGLGFLPGRLLQFPSNLRVPHMGWNLTYLDTTSRLLRHLPEKAYFYYIHSYRLPGVYPFTTGVCHYGGEFTAIVERENLFGVQFHPEKSGNDGLQIIRNFLKIVEELS
ncbi:MAG: imidazole glycerol phosphate synthase subunit HisH [Leptospiraceae bacterium]|nr:imidazole glycerol phosphate synthase subunit HisH [Leptospiraceae bacterium]MDW8307620.1 imidazole glycerol phosphate synthase subunit HisH [Leptospiraceae bacterium]